MDDYPDVFDEGDYQVGTWTCPHCEAVNSQIDAECQFCDGDEE